MSEQGPGQRGQNVEAELGRLTASAIKFTKLFRHVYQPSRNVRFKFSDVLFHCHPWIVEAYHAYAFTLGPTSERSCRYIAGGFYAFFH